MKKENDICVEMIRISDSFVPFVKVDYMEMDVEDIAGIYRKRWEIELLFKQLKQNFPLRYFYGESANAIKIQIWVTLIANLLLMVMQKRIRRTWSFSNLATMFRIMLMYYVNSYTFFEEPEKDWAKSMKKSSSLTQGGAQKLNFWQQFIEYNKENNGVYAKSTPSSDAWIGKSIKGVPATNVNLVITKDSCRIEAYINSGNQEKNKSIFDTLFAQKDIIEEKYGATLIWQRLDEKVTCRIYEDRPFSYTNEDDLQNIFEFFCDATNRMLSSFGSQAKLFKK